MNNPPILLINPKFPHNVGSTIRASSCYGEGKVYFTGDRFDVNTLKRLPREERMKGYVEWEDLGKESRPVDVIERKLKENFTPVAIELVDGSENLATFEHPDNALYIFGPEDGSIPRGIKTICHRFVHIPSFHCLNLSSAAYTVLYDRTVKAVQAGKMNYPSIEEEERGWYEPLL